MNALGVTALLLAIGFAGCLGDSDGAVDEVGSTDATAAPGMSPANETMDLGCGSCFEPTLAVWNDTLYLTTAGEERLFYRVSNGTWQALPAPVMDGDDPRISQGDIFIQTDAAGRLWWHSLYGTNSPAGTRAGTFVAMSPDGGQSWPLRHLLAWPAGPPVLPLAPDRNWLAVDGDTVVVGCTCPVVVSPMVRVSTDAGATFGPALPVTTAHGRPGPMGPLAVHGDTIVTGFIVGAGPTTQGGLQAQHVAVATSNDLGATWGRTDIAPLDSSGTLCCAFPNMISTDEGFRIAWSGSPGGVFVANVDVNGVDWSAPADVAAGARAAYPHAWPVAGTDGVIWRDADGQVMVAHNGTNVAVGQTSGVPSDYMHGVQWRGHIVTAWPDAADGVGLAYTRL